MNTKKITLKNEVLFKYIFASHQKEECLYLLKILVEGITNLKCKTIKINNPGIHSIDIGKLNFRLNLSITTENEKSIRVIIKMYHRQCNENAYRTFHNERYNLLSSIQEPVYQIVFVNDIGSNELIDEYHLQNKHKKEAIYANENLYYIYIKMINDYFKNKRYNELNEFAKILYIIENGFDYNLLISKDLTTKIIKTQCENFFKNKILAELYEIIMKLYQIENS